MLLVRRGKGHLNIGRKNKRQHQRKKEETSGQCSDKEVKKRRNFRNKAEDS